MVLTPLSTIFQLYRGGQFLLEKTGVPRENHKLYHIMEELCQGLG